ncbi:MAG: methyltransferase domain-containing protein [Streptosporangiaceae bacterium]
MEQLECRFCPSDVGEVVLDLGAQPAADHFPPMADPGPDPLHSLRMWLCARCGLAQLAEDPTTPEEPRGAEPEALARQARQAVADVAWLLPEAGVAAEFGSPHGGSWLGLLAERGLEAAEGPAGGPADVVVDCFGLMHDADQRAGLAERVDRLSADGTLLIQFHSLAAILAEGQWNALRHGHYAYYSTPVLVAMLSEFGLVTREAFRYPLYGGTVLLAAGRGGSPGASVRRVVAQEDALGVRSAAALSRLGGLATAGAESLSAWLRSRPGQAVGYGAASRAVALLCRAGVDRSLLPVVADASPAKQGRRIPGTDIPVGDPGVVLAGPVTALLFLADLLPEVRQAHPQVDWVLADRGVTEPHEGG